MMKAIHAFKTNLIQGFADMAHRRKRSIAASSTFLLGVAVLLQSGIVEARRDQELLSRALRQSQEERELVQEQYKTNPALERVTVEKRNPDARLGVEVGAGLPSGEKGGLRSFDRTKASRFVETNATQRLDVELGEAEKELAKELKPQGHRTPQSVY